jgi:hypothetical protein
VAPAIHKILSGAAKDGKEILDKAYTQISGAYNFVHRMIKLFYDPHSLTWAQAGSDGKTHKEHESAMAAGHYMLSGDFFENYEKFNSFFEILEHPDHFRRYKKLVIEREEFVKPSCESRWEDIFSDMLQRDKERNLALAAG